MKAQIAILKRLGAPDELIDSFKKACEINSGLPAEMKSNVSDLLEEQCRRFGFHDILPDGWFFRPFTLGKGFYRADGPARGNENEAAAIEQAYRRGISQGFADCRNMVEDGHRLQKILARESEIEKWRGRSIQRFGAIPGDTEKPPRKLFGGRSSLSLRIRWAVLKRDGFSCVACGVTAKGGAVLEVDHIIAHSKGGTDQIDNLQTLCFMCNRGKSSC